ncbi:MAG: GNAT family N-acetyltransferase [Candidatus Buchananbacteria bacterium]
MDKIDLTGSCDQEDKLTIRFATIEDIPLILAFIKELAEYEKMSDQVTATEEILKKTIFADKRAEVLISEYAGEPAGFMLFFYNFSTFLGKPGIYLEDWYVRPNLRGKGIGKAMLHHLAKIAIEKDCGRLEGWCLDWNESSIEFYKKMGAIPMSEWTVYRVTGKKLEVLGTPAA